MKKNFSKIILVPLFLVLLVPTVAFAAWWNPFTWKIFQKRETIQQTQVETTTPDRENNELQKQTDIPKKQESTATPSVLKQETKKETAVVDNSIAIQAQAKAQIEAELKAKATIEAENIKARIEAEKILREEQARKFEESQRLIRQQQEELQKTQLKLQESLVMQQQQRVLQDKIQLEIFCANYADESRALRESRGMASSPAMFDTLKKKYAKCF